MLWLTAASAVAGGPGANLLWYRDGQLTVQAAALQRELLDAASYGLRASDYVVAPLDGSERSDRALSDAALRFAAHLHSGRIDPHSAGFHLSGRRRLLDGPAIVARLASSTDVAAELRTLEPPFVHYRLLKQALARYRQLAEQPPLTRLPALPRQSLAAGDAYAGAPALRRQLHLLGDLRDSRAVESTDSTIDAQLVEAIARFQARHGLKADGRLGRATLAALVTPLSDRIRQIELTLERWRWLPELTTPPIIVNIPQYRLFAFTTVADRAADILQIPVIVGQTYPHTRTPVFVSELRYLVFRPYWDVPRSIVLRELLGAIRASATFMTRNHFELVRGEGDDGQVVEPSSGNIEALANGQLRLRQRPGDDNALGLIKFVMPNDYKVYLHDSPAHELFSAPRRTFSHGCIRVADPVALAVHVLRGNAGDWSKQSVMAAMHGGDAQRVELVQPVTVMVLYGTVLATEDGRVQFFDDIYGQDRRLAHLLRAAPRR